MRGERHESRTSGRRRDHVFGETVIIIVIGLVLIASALLPAMARSTPDRSAASVCVTVQAGDTLWSLARRHAPEGWTASETRAELIRLNPSSTDTLDVGAGLRVPIEWGSTLIAER
jgi:LysM repeat protein